jgi:RimJ/RimL family protein N-acetyltransferase
MAIMRLKEHTITLHGEYVTLRPMTEDDWPFIEKWEDDPEILYLMDADPVVRSPQEVRAIFRTVSQRAYCFMIEYEERTVGNCWLQEMDLPVILEKYPGKDCRRIDMVIGEKALWGKGLGTDILRTLVRFAFAQERADLVFGLPGEHNPRSRRALEKAGFIFVMKLEEPPPAQRRYCDVLVIERAPGD